MVEQGRTKRVRLSLDVEPELRRKIKVAAAERDMCVKDYCVAILRAALQQQEAEDQEDIRDMEAEIAAYRADPSTALPLDLARPKRKPPVRRGKPFTKGDALFNIIGIAQGPADDATDVSANKLKYLAEAYTLKAE